jgi:hypothetical protein
MVTVDGFAPDPVQSLQRRIGSWDNTGSNAHRDSLENLSTYGFGEPTPSGSEGPLKYHVDRTGGTGPAGIALVKFWGDLRDYDERLVREELIPWFKGALSRIHTYDETSKTMFMLRQVGISIDVERGIRWVITSSNDTGGISVTESTDRRGSDSLTQDDKKRVWVEHIRQRITEDDVLYQLLKDSEQTYRMNHGKSYKIDHIETTLVLDSNTTKENS